MSAEPVTTPKRRKNEVCYLQQVRRAQGSRHAGEEDFAESSQLLLLEGRLIVYRAWHIPKHIYFRIVLHTLRVQKWRIRVTLGQIVSHYEIIVNKVVLLRTSCLRP